MKRIMKILKSIASIKFTLIAVLIFVIFCSYIYSYKPWHIKQEYTKLLNEGMSTVLEDEGVKKYQLTDISYYVEEVIYDNLYERYVPHVIVECKSSNSDLDSWSLREAIKECIPEQMGYKVGIFHSAYGYMVTLKVNDTITDRPDLEEEAYGGGWFRLFWPICGIVAALILDMIFFALRKNKEELLIAREEQTRANIVEFYKLCKQNGISSFTSAKDAQKGELLAKQLNLSTQNLQDLFNEGKNRLQEKEKAIEESSLNEMRAKEKKEQSELLRFSGLTGRNKRIAMLQAKYNEAISLANSLDAYSNALIASSNLKEKEDTWGYAGGIASAIAGPAAGVAAAIESQRRTAQENARIREQNRRNKEWIAPIVLDHSAKEHEARKQASYLAKDIESAKVCLVSDELTSQECFDKLSFSKVKVQQSKTGTCTINATVKVEPFYIFKDVPAVIDGEVFATVYRDGAVVGTATAVFPVHGANNADIMGMALYCNKSLNEKAKYKVKFSPKQLWAMEAMK